MELKNLQNLALAGLISFALSLLLVPLVARLAAAVGMLAKPRPDRWSGRPTPLMGGLAVFVAYLAPLPWFLPPSSRIWWLVAAGACMLILGLWDDKYHLLPQTKLVGQILSVCLLLVANFGFQFKPFAIVGALASILWIVAVINAVNLMDNMDGLAPGVSLIAMVCLVFLLGQAGKTSEALLAAAMGGALAGFLVFNFPPARIFLGDSGSLSIGITLGALSLSTALVAEQKLGTVSLILGPALVMAIPLLDVVLVSITRMLSGRPISQGGRDHTSHRLVQLGLSERKTVSLLYGLSALSGLGALFLTTRWTLPACLVLVPLLWVGLGLFFVYLARVKMTPAEKLPANPNAFSVILGMAFKRRILEVVMDLGLSCACFCLAYLLRFDFTLYPEYRIQIVRSLPWVLASTLFCFQLSGIYRGILEYQGMRDALRLVKAVSLAVGMSVFWLVLLYRFERYPRSVFPLYGILLFLGAGATRCTFKILELLFPPDAAGKIPVLIYGANNLGVTAFHEISQREGGFRATGFLDDAPERTGLKIHGLPLYGDLDHLERIGHRVPFEKILVADENITPEALERLRVYARTAGKEMLSFKVLYQSIN